MRESVRVARRRREARDQLTDVVPCGEATESGRLDDEVLEAQVEVQVAVPESVGAAPIGTPCVVRADTATRTVARWTTDLQRAASMTRRISLGPPGRGDRDAP